MTAKLRHHSLFVRKLQELLHECNVQLATFKNCVQQIGTPIDNIQMRHELENSVQACVRTCEAVKNYVLPQLKHEGVEFTRHASQFIGCVNACVVELKRCEALENTYRIQTVENNSNVLTTSVDGKLHASASPRIPIVEAMLESLENLITVHYSTSEAPDTKVTPKRQKSATCRPQCICSKLKTSYA